MNNQVTGTVCQIDETKEYGDRGFRKRQIVLVQNQGKYDNYIPLEFIQDSCDMADGLKSGLEITCEFRISGRKWTSPETGDIKYFQNLEIVDIINYDEVAEQSMSNETDAETEDVPF